MLWGSYVMIDFPDAPGPGEEPSGEPRKRRKNNRVVRWGVSAAAIEDGTYSRMHEAEFRLSKALTRMLLGQISNDPQRATAVLDALAPGQAEVPVLVDLGKHLAARDETMEAAVAVLKHACAVAPDDEEACYQLASVSRRMDGDKETQGFATEADLKRTLFGSCRGFLTSGH